MRVVTATLGPYKSITQLTLAFDEQTTVLVGVNEAGKSAILEALYKSRPAAEDLSFDSSTDYPKTSRAEYDREHPSHDTEVSTITFRLEDSDRAKVFETTGFELAENFEYSQKVHYNNNRFISGIGFPEGKMVELELGNSTLLQDHKEAIAGVKTYRELLASLSDLADLSSEEVVYRDSLAVRIRNAETWKNLGSYEIYAALKPLTPAFIYFSDYYLLPGKANLKSISERLQSKTLRPSDRTVIALLRIAKVELNDLLQEHSFGETRDRLEALSNELTRRVFQYWKQNDQLAVAIDVRPDTTDEPPFNQGPNLYIGIRDKRHSVTIPFEQRSRGFVWFFSFLVWFDSVQEQIDAKVPLVLLLDEPALSLHASAQSDFLVYIETLARTHQVVYTTHSPFMVRSDELQRVRVVEDHVSNGTIVSDRLDGGDPKSVLPLQAALGYSLAQNLFIAERNLIVEGPSDLIYLQAASTALEACGREGLDSGIVTVPAGGLNNVSAFVALFGGNQLKYAVCVDYAGQPDQRLESMIKHKILPKTALIDFSMFRREGGSAGDATDIEDLFGSDQYLSMFHDAYGSTLKGRKIELNVADADTRITKKIERALLAAHIQLRPTGGFNHYLVATSSNSKGLKFSPLSLDAFEALFKEINRRLGGKTRRAK